jgi:hypothetical protein
LIVALSFSSLIVGKSSKLGEKVLIVCPVMQDLISLFQPEIRPDNLRPLALLLELLTVIPEEFSTLLLPSQKRAQVASSWP